MKGIKGVGKAHASVTAVGERLAVTEYNMPAMDQLCDDNIFTSYYLPDGTEDIYITIETDSTFNLDIQISFDTGKNNNGSNISVIESNVLVPTSAPTSPSQSPIASSFPTESSIDKPTNSPTVPSPTTSPASIATTVPTESPTYALYLEATQRSENDTQSNFSYYTKAYKNIKIIKSNLDPT